MIWLITTKFQAMMHATVGVPKGYSLSEADQVLVNDLIRSILPIQPRQAGFVFDMFTSNLDMDQHLQAYSLEELRVPTLIISAIDDPLVKYENARAMAERILLLLATIFGLIYGRADRVPPMQTPCYAWYIILD